VYYAAASDMFSLKVMPLNRTLTISFAILLAVMSPLRGYAALANCGAAFISAPAAAAHGAHLSHCAHGAGVPHAHGAGILHAHDCGSCCCVAAIALTPARWMVPPPTALRISAWMIWPPPAVIQDRLDRPPRLLFL
jgi:hypothetical protein